jgi:hypothetical protein
MRPRALVGTVASIGSLASGVLHAQEVRVAASLAEEYGFTDIDGKRPRPLSLGEA